MKFCNDHWQSLRSAVDTAGLAEFVPPDAKEAARRTRLREKGEKTRETYDPLTQAMLSILGHSLAEAAAQGGVPFASCLLADHDEGGPCPLCLLNFMCSDEAHAAHPTGADWTKIRDALKERTWPGPYDEFITFAADEQREHVKELL